MSSLPKDQIRSINEQIDIDIILGVIPYPANMKQRLYYYHYLINKLNLPRNYLIQNIVIRRLSS